MRMKSYVQYIRRCLACRTDALCIFMLIFMIIDVRSASAQKLKAVPILIHSNIIFEDDSRKVYLHWFATSAEWAMGLKVTCRLAASGNRAILYQWNGVKPGHLPAMARVELGDRERLMLVGLRDTERRRPRELVACNAINTNSSGLKYDAEDYMIDAQVIQSPEQARPRLRARLVHAFFATPDKPAIERVRCATFFGSFLGEVVEFETGIEADGSPAAVDAQLSAGSRITGVQCAGSRLRLRQ
jgi:hypothetical protein